MDFAVPAVHRIKLKESEKKDKFLDLAREYKKAMEHEGDDYTKRDLCFRYNNERIIKCTGGHITWRRSRDHPNDSIVENDQNIEKSPGYLLSLKLQWKSIS